MEIFFFWLLCAIVAAVIGGRRNRTGTGFFLGVLFGPFGILFALLLKGNRIKCSYCRELIDPQATVCPHCRTELSRGTPTTPESLGKVIVCPHCKHEVALADQCGYCGKLLNREIFFSHHC